jgi:hypothetical protein
MKRTGIIFLMAILMGAALIPGRLTAGNDDKSDQVKVSGPTQVYYFHLSRRCMTCQTVEKVAEQSVKDLYPEALKNGNVTFKSVNIEDKANKALLKKLKVSGQSLLIVNGQDKIDITDKGFLYAVNEPDKLKAEIKTILEKFVK